MLNLQQILVNKLIQNNPAVMNNPRAQEMLQVVQSGDAQRGQEIADNLCRTYGVTREQAVQQARLFFKI